MDKKVCAANFNNSAKNTKTRGQSYLNNYLFFLTAELEATLDQPL
jgi:hypothetical protein